MQGLSLSPKFSSLRISFLDGTTTPSGSPRSAPLREPHRPPQRVTLADRDEDRVTKSSCDRRRRIITRSSSGLRVA